MDTDNAAVLQVLLAKIARLEHAVIVQGATEVMLGGRTILIAVGEMRGCVFSRLGSLSRERGEVVMSMAVRGWSG